MSAPSSQSTVERVRQFFEAAPSGIAAAYVFGSQARGTAGDGSDVDVAVLFGKEPPHTLNGPHAELAHALELALGRPVDIVVLNHVAVDLAHRVLLEGVLVCDLDRSARVRFEVRTRNEYFDLEPFLLRYRRPA
ncbi:MAG: type VII toxin-antitoxin system MntA family adenylyltransferase antitoxin [Bacteroidales bacterium]